MIKINRHFQEVSCKQEGVPISWPSRAEPISCAHESDGKNRRNYGRGAADRRWDCEDAGAVRGRAPPSLSSIQASGLFPQAGNRRPNPWDGKQLTLVTKHRRGTQRPRKQEGHRSSITRVALKAGRYTPGIQLIMDDLSPFYSFFCRTKIAAPYCPLESIFDIHSIRNPQSMGRYQTTDV